MITKKIKPVKKKILPKVSSEDKYPYYREENKDMRFDSLKSLMNEVYCNDVSEYGEVNLSKQLNSNEFVSFDCEINATRHTCGFHEVGDLSTKCLDANLSHLVEILDSLVLNANGKTMFMNTNGKYDCIILEKALPKCKYWTKVKEYNNPNSGNTLTLWVTNN